jgi:predicted transcriptional regulator
MSRNDGALYSGLASPARLRTEKKKEEVTKLDPKAEAVLEELAKMKAQVTNVESILVDDSLTLEQRVRQVERMRDRYEDLNNLEKRMKTLLGVPRG